MITTTLVLFFATAPGDVERVVVFADRAEVVRGAPAVCAGGVAQAVFANLPDAIDPRTLRGEVDGDAVVVGVSTTTAPIEEPLDERVKAMRAESRSVEERLTALGRAEQDDAERARSTWSYGPFFRALAVEDMRAPKPDVARWDQLVLFLRKEGDAAAERKVARNAEVRVLMRTRERLQARVALFAPPVTASRVNATVSVRCGASATPRVRLSYVVPGAVWTPEYDLRFTRDGAGKIGEGKASITVAGVVAQATGEDWNDVEVWLSTAKPLLGGEAPLPNPIHVTGGPVEEQKTLVQAQEHRADALQRGGASGGEVAGASLQDGGKAFVLKLPVKVTVKSDGRPYWFPVDEVTTKAVAALVAVPTLSPSVYQVASLKNPARYPLMAGRVHVFRGATYVGDEDVGYTAPGEPMEISLGRDDELRIERQDLSRQRGSGSLLSGNQTIAQAWRTKLQNRSDGDVVVELREQIPVSKTTDISVVIEDKTTAGYRLDKVRGHLSWTVALKRGAVAERDVVFTIKLPKEWAVQ